MSLRFNNMSGVVSVRSNAQEILEKFIALSLTNKTMTITEYAELRRQLTSFATDYKEFIVSPKEFINDPNLLNYIERLCYEKAKENFTVKYNEQELIACAERIYAVITGKSKEIEEAILNPLNKQFFLLTLPEETATIAARSATRLNIRSLSTQSVSSAPVSPKCDSPKNSPKGRVLLNWFIPRQRASSQPNSARGDSSSSVSTSPSNDTLSATSSVDVLSASSSEPPRP